MPVADRLTSFNMVSPGWFRTYGMRLIAGAAVAWALLRRMGEGPEARGEPVPEAVRAVADRSPCLPGRVEVAEVLDEAGA